MDSLNEWPEVLFINGYAVFIGYLMMGVRGLSVLVITWTTVVLLGGFVSVLGKKDFWCLTVITLIQTVRAFSFLLKERLVDLARSWWGLLGATMVVKPMRNGTEDEDERYNTSTSRALLTCALSTIQALVFVIILCPMAVLFVFGMYISAGLGLWRLVEHDFSSDAAEAAGVNHLKPALQVLYSLAVAQGVLFGYKTMHAWGAKVRLAEFVAGRYLLHEDKELVADYLEHTVAGCEKDPSFANGRNLVTYSVDLITDARSDDSFVAGVRLLGAANRHGQEALAQKLLTRSSSSLIRMIQRLLETLDPRRRYSATTRQSAGRIAALVAGTVFLEQCPGMIQCVSSLLDRFEEFITVPPKDYEQEWRHGLGGPRCDFLLPVQQGLTVLRNLAYREDNCRAMIHTEGLLLRATAPLTSHHLFYENSHFTWGNMADESLTLMCLLAEVPGETGAKLRSEISRSQKAIFIRTLEATLECPKCKLLLKRRVLEMLLDLSVDTAPVMAREGRTSRVFIWMLLLIFVSTKDCFAGVGFSIRQMKRRIHIRRVAGEMLSSSNQELSAMLSLQRSDNDDQGRAWTMLQSVRFLLGDLAAALLDVGNISIRVPAAKFLEDLCYDFGSHDEYSKELQKALVRVMPQVLRELLGYMLTREEAQVVTQENNIPALSEDIESGGVSQDFAKETPSSHQQMGEQPEDTPSVREALLTSLCMTVQSRWYRFDLDFARQLDEVARKVGSEQGKDVNNFSDLPFLPIWRRNLVIS